jgi:hypothetical protein
MYVVDKEHNGPRKKHIINVSYIRGGRLKDQNIFLASSTVNDMFTHFEQLRYLDFYTLIKLSVILPHGVCKIPRKF